MSRRSRLASSAALAAAFLVAEAGRSLGETGSWEAPAGGSAAAQLADSAARPAAPTTRPTSVDASLPLFRDLSAPVYLQAGTLPPGAVTPAAPPPAPMDQRPLMALLGPTTVGKALQQVNVNVYGWIEGSYTYNLDNPAPNGHAGQLNFGRLFDIEDNDFLINQLDLTFERKAQLSGDQWDVGGRVDLLYGTDARFIHSGGLLDHEGFDDGPQYQFDIPQLYADIAVPVGDGLRIRLGKFEFFKPTDPNASLFYSHTFLYAASGQGSGGSRRENLTIGGALPFTLTGASAYYSFGKLSAEVGFSRGWDQSIGDNNGAIDGFGRVRYKLADTTSITFAMISGPEINRDDEHYRTSGDLSLYHEVNENLALLFDGLYGLQARPDAPQFGVGGDAHWYGVSGNAIYKLNKYASVAGRLEWFRDEQGFTTDVAQNLYEATLGLTITPFPDSPTGSHLQVRPEIRYDYSDKRYFNFDAADGELSSHHQWTVAIDAIYNF